MASLLSVKQIKKKNHKKLQKFNSSYKISIICDIKEHLQDYLCVNSCEKQKVIKYSQKKYITIQNLLKRRQRFPAGKKLLLAMNNKSSHPKEAAKKANET